MEAITNLLGILFKGCWISQHDGSGPFFLEAHSMPKTLHYRPLLIDKFITNERIQSYQTIFHPTNDVELMGAYLWNGRVCGALYPLLAAVEVTLRNAIDQSLAADLGQFWWAGSKLRYRSFKPDINAPHAVQALRENFSKATRSYIAESRRRHGVHGRIAPRHDGVIAKTTFSTWEFLLNPEFQGRGLIWPKHLSTIFRGPWPTRQTRALLTYAHDLVATLRDFRNRLFHHEPAWKRYDVLNQADALRHLHEKIGKTESLLTLIHPENLRLLNTNGLLRDARRACCPTEIQRFQHLAHVHPIKSLRELAALVDRSAVDNRILAAQISQGQPQPFLIWPQ
ncbi:CAAX protease [Achromobacter kerstersii]